MIIDGYWEERGEIIKVTASRKRAAACFAAASADEHSRLEGTLEAGFSYWAFYLAGVGHAIRVHFTRMIDADALLEELPPT